MNFTRTENGCLAYGSTGSHLVNLFFKIGASRNSIEEVKQLFKQAFEVDPLRATAILCWARSPRGGAGERKVFRELLKDICSNSSSAITWGTKVINLIPEIGRFDDLKTAYGTVSEFQAINVWRNAINEKNVLAAKWATREDKKLQKAFGLNEAGLRKLLSSIRKNAIPEAKMCAGEWDQIEYDKIPSLCGSRHAKAFRRHDEERYQEFLDNKETKVNASVLYPYEVFRMGIYGDQKDAAQKYWDNLPDLGLKASMLPLIDVSRSMCCLASGKIQCIDISISLGTYLAEKVEGPFNGMAITFSSRPQLVSIPNGNIIDKFRFVKGMDWGGSTDIQAAYRLILQKAKQLNISQSQMPKYLVVLSDMQFNQNYGGDLTALEQMKKEFYAARYTMPKMVWWNLCSSNGFPSMVDEPNSCMISGFSPEVMKAVLAGEVLTPESVMMRAINPFVEMLK